jgi:protein required for attachment to host cells
MGSPDSPLGAKSYWVVVADEYRATLFSREKKYSPMQELESLQNDTAREKDQDLVSDRSGRSFDSSGQGRHAMGGGESGAKAQSYLVFAKEIAERISRAKQRGLFDRLVVVAAPRFLGVLRPALMSAGVETDRAIDKEVTGRDAAFIQSLIDAD